MSALWIREHHFFNDVKGDMPKLVSRGGSRASDSDMRRRHSSRSLAEGTALSKTDVVAAPSSVDSSDSTSATVLSSSHKDLLLLDKAVLFPLRFCCAPSLLTCFACTVFGPPTRPCGPVAPGRVGGSPQGRRCSARRPPLPRPRGVGTGAARGPRLSTAGTPLFAGDWQRC